jgi:hypothetical protein
MKKLFLLNVFMHTVKSYSQSNTDRISIKSIAI